METFVVRIWAPADPAEDPVVTGRVQGRLEHVTSGRGWSFRGVTELGQLIQVQLGQSPVGELDTSGAVNDGQGED